MAEKGLTKGHGPGGGGSRGGILPWYRYRATGVGTMCMYIFKRGPYKLEYVWHDVKLMKYLGLLLRQPIGRWLNSPRLFFFLNCVLLCTHWYVERRAWLLCTSMCCLWNTY